MDAVRALRRSALGAGFAAPHSHPRPWRLWLSGPVEPSRPAGRGGERGRLAAGQGGQAWGHKDLEGVPARGTGFR